MQSLGLHVNLIHLCSGTTAIAQINEGLLLSRFSRVQLCATPQTAAHQAPRPWDSPGKNTGMGCHFLLQCMKVKSESEVAQLCPTLSDPMDCILPGSSVHGIFQARVLERGAIAFSNEGLHMYNVEHTLAFMKNEEKIIYIHFYFISKEALEEYPRHQQPWIACLGWRRKWQPTPVFLPGESHGQRSLGGGLQSMGWQRVGCD